MDDMALLAQSAVGFGLTPTYRNMLEIDAQGTDAKSETNARLIQPRGEILSTIHPYMMESVR